MGMNTITIDILPQEIQYIYSNGTWKFEGISNISYYIILNKFRELKFKKLGDNFYTDNKSIDLRVLEREDKLVTIRVEGLVTCFDNVIEASYNLAHFFNKIFKLKFCVLGDYIEYGQYDKYSANVRRLYQVKLDCYENGYLKDFLYVIPPHKFNRVYNNYIRKRKILNFLNSSRIII